MFLRIVQWLWLALGLLPCATVPSAAIDCEVVERAVFLPQHKPVLLVKPAGADGTQRAVVFRTPLRVNTDGAPNSYHPQDLSGKVKAINNICNAIAVRTVPPGDKKLTCAEQQAVFARFRDAGWVVPDGYKISWTNVLAARTQNGRKVPCVFGSGEYAGYLGSMTHLQNDLPSAERGECEVKNELDQRVVPALVMTGGDNPQSQFGAAIGDLVLAYNPSTQAVVAAVVGDSGPPDNLGEGSVALNMALLGRTEQPTTYADAKRLDTGRQDIVVAVFPKTRSFAPQKPFSKENIADRAAQLVKEIGFDTPAQFAEFAERCLTLP